MSKAIAILKQKYFDKYQAPPGKKKCTLSLADDCYGVAKEEKFKGRICLNCRKVQLKVWYNRRIVARGGKMKRGRKPLSDADSD
jgi:hypothetical protein